MDNNYQNQEPNKLTKGQKMSVIGLSIFAILIIFMWGAQFKKNINSSFVYNEGEITDNQKSDCADGKCDKQSEEDLRAKDTDSDGLSDWDELYFYKTSPYLEDSDSDGFLDKNEIDSDNDPSCPAGRDCYNSGIVDGSNDIIKDQEKDINSLNSILNKQGEIQAQEELGIDETGLEFLLGGDIDATTLRQLLESAGMDGAILDQFSDEELLKSYQETLN